MDRSLLKTVTLCLVVATFLVGCGVKPTLNGLEVPEKSKSVARETPADADTIDGNVDEQEPLSKSKEKRGFILDFLL